MGEKDLTEKQLLELEDVFADIVNVLLFDGKPLVQPEELQPAGKDSFYKDNDLKVRMQERDVAKLWIRENVRLAFFGLEDQTVIDSAMPIRILSYDAAVYRAALRERNERKIAEVVPFYPAITLVLYFDYEKRWTSPRALKDCFKNIPPELEPYISDYKINVFEIAWLSDETVSKFKSDFRFVANYYVQMRKTGNWIPMPGEVKHIKELFDLLSVVTSDTRFIEIYNSTKGEKTDMSSAALDYWEKFYTDKGIARGKDMAMLKSIRSLMETLKLTAKQAMDALRVPDEDRKRYDSQL